MTNIEKKERRGITACLETREGFKKMITLPEYLPRIRIAKSPPLSLITEPNEVSSTPYFKEIEFILYKQITPYFKEIEFILYKQITPHFFLYKER